VHNADPLLTPDEVARVLRITPQTLARWARENKIETVVLPSGRTRYRTSVVRALLFGGDEAL
jgi:excisionase family DNA binding protein